MAEKTQTAPPAGTYWQGWLRRFLLLLAPAFLMCFTVIFFGPLDIVNANQMYLTFTAGSIAPAFGLVTIGATLVIAALFAFIPGRARGLAIGLLLGVAVMFYVQAGFMNSVIGTLDGNTFDWHDFPQEAIKNIVIWGVVLAAMIALAVLFPEQARTVCLIVCLALFVAQMAALVTGWVPDNDDSPNYQLSGDRQFTFSTDENIIFITLDQFNPLIFEEQLEMDPSLRDIFKDFLYFDNMSSCYSFTFPSLMYLATHQYLDTTVPTREAVYNAWHSEQAQQFYDALHDDGYEVNLYMESNYAALGAENMLGKADNVVEAGDLVVTPLFFEFVLDMSLYRYMPIMLKNDFCVSTGGIVDISTYEGVKKLRINYDFLSSLEEEGLTLTDETKMFNWYHMAGAHFPYVVDYDGYLCAEDETDRDEQLHGYLVMLGHFFDELKAIGVYDDATIIISADHGYFECFQAVGMVKLSGETRDEMEVASAPVSQEDIMPTILWVLGEDYSDFGRAICLSYGNSEYEEGRTVFDIRENERRLRTTRVWGYMTQYPDVEWIGNLDQWDAEANGFERYNVFGVFTYNGDRDTILDQERYWYNFGYATAIEPLYDSFY